MSDIRIKIYATLELLYNTGYKYDEILEKMAASFTKKELLQAFLVNPDRDINEDAKDMIDTMESVKTRTIN